MAAVSASSAGPTSAFSRETVAAVADAQGLILPAEEVQAALLHDVDARLRTVIQTAAKFMRAAKRDVLTPDDVNNALRARNIEPIYGYHGAADPNGSKFMRLMDAGNENVFFLADDELDLKEMFAEPLPPCPVDVAVTAHWLAVDGTQPTIPQNPPVGRSVASGTDSVEVRPLVRHILSKELQVFFEKVTQSITSDDEKMITPALQSLRVDPGLHQLLPYFTQFISDKVQTKTRNLKLLKSLMRMVGAFLENKTLNLDPYLHQLLIAVMTCVVSKQLSEAPKDDHWSLREMAAVHVASIVYRFGDIYLDLRKRTTKTLLNALLEPGKPLPTRYGAIVALTKLGVPTIRALILPNAVLLAQTLSPLMSENASSPIERKQAIMCFNAIKSALFELVHDNNLSLENGSLHQSAEERVNKAFGSHAPQLCSIFRDSFTGVQ